MFDPQAISSVVATLTELFRHQGKQEIANLLSSAHAQCKDVDFDNWNGGTTFWELQLQIPVGDFAALENRIPDIEKEINAKCDHFNRDGGSNVLRGATIGPILVGQDAQGQRMTPAAVEVRRLWGEGRFRLFISHLSKDKLTATAIREALAIRGVQAFVAHEDIEPTREWQDEIELALRSMHALAALLTPEFHKSNWTDQEIGWALGRGLIVVPIRLGIDPYGLIQKIQGRPGRTTQPKMLAAGIAETLLRNPQCHVEMRRAVIHAIRNASTIESATALSQLLPFVTKVTEEERKHLWEACQNNPVVRASDDAVAAIHAIAGKPRTVPSEDDIPF